jgi:hypothetical protein
MTGFASVTEAGCEIPTGHLRSRSGLPVMKQFTYSTTQGNFAI